MNMMNLNNKSNRELNITTTPAPPSTPFPTPIPASSPTPANNNNNPHSPISKWSGHVLSMWPLRCTYSFVLFVILALFNLFDHCWKNGLSRGIFVWIRKDSCHVFPSLTLLAFLAVERCRAWAIHPLSSCWCLLWPLSNLLHVCKLAPLLFLFFIFFFIPLNEFIFSFFYCIHDESGMIAMLFNYL